MVFGNAEVFRSAGCSARRRDRQRAQHCSHDHHTFPSLARRQALTTCVSKAMSIVEVFLLAIALLHCTSAAGAAEIFNETLTVRSLRDGRVSTRFSFVTALEHAVPRSPETLNVSDTGTYIYLTFPYWNLYWL